MQQWEHDSIDAEVVICGGGLAGLCAARQLRREIPEARIILVDRTPSPLPEACHKVGESSVELASRYFGHTLGLESYLRERHLIKNGLRFLPGGGDTLPIADRTEIGPPELPVVPSYQLDRGRMENDLRAMCVEDGVDARFGIGVSDVELGGPGEAHRVHLADGTTLRARFVIDASGRRQLIARKLGLQKENGHLAHASWFRVVGPCRIEQLVPKEDESWHRRDLDGVRWLSTTHFMGPGYWLWFIPLSSGYTSVGIVVHGELHPFETINTLERSLAWIEKHEPIVRKHLETYEIADFRCYRSYSYGSKQVFSADRWACVGEAGLFVDPFYSPGSDFIALANSFTTQLVRAELAGEDLRERAAFFDSFYLRTAFIATEIYRQAAPVYGKPQVMAAKIYWDNFNYWSWLCQYFFQDIWRLPLAEQEPFVAMGQRFAELGLRAQSLFAEWARRGHDHPERRHVVVPPIPSLLANLHIDLEKPMTPAETLAYMEDKVTLARELLGELLLRAIAAVGPDEGRALVEAVDAKSWSLPELEARIEVELGDARSRRRRLSKLARDVERCLGRMDVHESVTSVPDLCQQVLGLHVSAPLHAAP
jgi:flavin-dependent dehydrogenase